MSQVQIKKIVLPIDGSDSSFQAARYAARLAKLDGAEISCIHVIEIPTYGLYGNFAATVPTYYDEITKTAEKWFDQVRDLVRNEGTKVNAETIMNATSVPDSIVNHAVKIGADVIVMGTRGRTGVKKFLLGSVASAVVSHAHCPVLVVR